MRERVARLFAGRGAASDTAIGAELELIPVRADSKQRVAILPGPAGPGTAEMIRPTVTELGWIEANSAYGAPEWRRMTGRISYEPGGQIEISSPVCSTPDDLMHFLSNTVTALRSAAREHGVELLAVGIDPYNEVASVPLQLHAPRYELMTRHFERIGPAGIRMMRQTASLQVNLEVGPRPFERWRLLNALAPYLTAAFANSRTYALRDTGHASHRAVLWRTLDPSRTGIPYDASDPVGAYTRFAEQASRILEDDASHLSTLFPEVRPRGYFELRSLDAVELDRARDAVDLVSTLVYDRDATMAAIEVLGDPDPTLLQRAAVDGRADPAIAATITELETIAGAARAR